MTRNGWPSPLPDVVEGANVRMVQGGGSAGFAPEPLQCSGIPGEPAWKQLDGHAAAEPRVDCAIHLPHAARPQRGGNTIGPESLAFGQLGQARLRLARERGADKLERGDFQELPRLRIASQQGLEFAA